MARLRFAALLFCGVALSACSGSSEPNMAQMRSVEKELAGDLDAQIRRAQILRVQGNYAEATRALSQMMLAVPDDPRVVGEYGKLLTQKGMPQDAIAFLRRATELNSTDWTLYSALGVAYDQINDPNSARVAYDRALALKPGEPSILNNYAMSRMLAKDLPQAARLIHQAKAAGGKDPKIERNAQMIASLMPEEAPRAMAVVQQPVAQAAPRAPVAPVTRNELPRPVAPAASAPPVAAATPRPQPFVSLPAQSRPAPQTAPVASEAPRQPTGAPRSLQPQQMGAVSAQQAIAAKRPGSKVVMMEVPFDPLAGPVGNAKAEKAKAQRAPRTAPRTAVAKADAPKPESKVATAAPVKAETPKQVAKSETPAKPEAIKDTKPAAKTAAEKPMQQKPQTKPVKTQFADADAKPAKDSGIPRLRMADTSD